MANYRALEHMTYQEYLETGHWRQVRFAALWHAGFRCQLCGSTDNLEVHHSPQGYDHLFEERPEDVVVLCRKCHETHSLAEQEVF